MPLAPKARSRAQILEDFDQESQALASASECTTAEAFDRILAADPARYDEFVRAHRREALLAGTGL